MIQRIAVMGQKPATLLKQVAKDHGALAWTARGKLHFKSMADLIRVKPAFRYEFNNPQAKYRITKLSNINADFAVTASKRHRYVGYSMTEGYRAAGETRSTIIFFGTDSSIRFSLS